MTWDECTTATVAAIAAASGQPQLAAVLAIGCPVHGNAGMTVDEDGPYCGMCVSAGLAEETALENIRAIMHAERG